MSTNDNTQQTQPQAGPIAQQLAKIQSDGQPPPAKKSKWGFSDRTAWDWLNLIGILLVPLMIGVFTIVSNTQQSNLSQQQHDIDLRIAADQQQETTLETYLDKMSDLVTSKDLNDPVIGKEIRLIIQARTLTVLKRLDSPRVAIVLQFLIQSNLILKGHPIISLSSLILTQPNLIGINLSTADLSGAQLIGARLQNADLSETNLFQTNLSGADLSNANLSYANLSKANLTRANLNGAVLNFANLQGALVTPEQLVQAASLHGIVMPDGSIHP